MLICIVYARLFCWVLDRGAVVDVTPGSNEGRGTIMPHSNVLRHGGKAGEAEAEEVGG